MSSPSASRSGTLNLEQILDEKVDWRYKSFPAGTPVTIRDVGRSAWNVLGGEFLLPIMVLKDSALRHNLRVMEHFCRAQGISLAPHGKTHMSPQLLQMQLDAGAWGVTVATISQARVYRAFGAARIILANELVDTASARWAAEELERDSEFELFCLVDSSRGVEWLDGALASHGPRRRLNVLLEVGMPAGRGGCRTAGEAREVAEAVVRSRHLRLAGVEAFEGIIHSDDQSATLDAVDRFLAGVRDLIVDLDAAQVFDHAEEVLVTAGGSAFPDRVVRGLGGPWRLRRPVRVVVRSGCYVTHDAAHYMELSPFGGRLPDTAPLSEALEVWGAVLSQPEPGLAILGFGKRDVSFDLGLPIPRFVMRDAEPVRALNGSAQVVALNDQHAYLRYSGADLRVGDVVGCGISHPCTAFDKWRLIPVVDNEYRVLDAVLTYF